MPSAQRPMPQTAVMTKIRTDREVRFNMRVSEGDLRTTLGLLRKFAETRPRHYPVILCFVTGPTLPEHCAEMPRWPRPPTGTPLDDEFGSYVAAEVARAPALHDGAIIVSRSSAKTKYCVSGWSYRLLSPHQPTTAEANRGSAYNSAIAMSLVEHVDLVALVLEGGVEVYLHGQRVGLGARDDR